MTTTMRGFPSILKVLTIIRPETLVRWYRAGFSLLLALEVAPTGRATADRHGATRIGLGFEVAQSSVANYMVKRRWWLSHHPTRPQRPRLDQRQSKSDGRMGCTSNSGGI